MSSQKCEKTSALSGCAVLPRQKGKNQQPMSGAENSSRRKPNRTANRFQVLNEFVDSSMVGLSKVELGVWFILYRDTKPNGSASTSMSDMARRIGVSRRSVVTAVSQLERRGLITVAFRGGFRKGMNIYRVNSLATHPE